MIIYGWNSKVLKQAPFPGHTCPACERGDSQIIVSRNYFHIFWIPFFPYSKKLTIVCGTCSQETKPKNVSEEVKSMAKQLKSSVKTPIWMFSGLFVIALLIAAINIINSQAGNRQLEYLNTPEVNDVYIIHQSSQPYPYQYTCWKVRDIKGDTLFVSANAYYYDGVPQKLEDEDGFSSITFDVNISYLKTLFEDGDLRQIERYYSGWRGFHRDL